MSSVKCDRGDLTRIKLTIPPHRLFTSTGTLVKITVLVVTKMKDTAEMLIREVARVFTQLTFKSVQAVYIQSGRTYKFSLEVTVRALGIGATAVRISPARRVYFPFIHSSSLPVPKETINPITPMGRKRMAVSPADKLSTCCAIRTI